MAPIRSLRVLCVLCVFVVAGAGRRAFAQAQTGGLKLEVTAVNFSADRVRKEQFLTLTVEITGTDPSRLRRVQPLRDDFQVQAGKTVLPCRWLRGGSLPDDPNRLQFTLGFSRPPGGVKTVALRANLPRLEGDDVLDVVLNGLQTGGARQERRGAGWKLTVSQFETAPYVAPSLPARGQFFSKGGAVDVRVFRKADPKDPAPERAISLGFDSGSIDLFDPTLDVSGTLVVEGGPSTPLLSALLRRDPSRTVKDPRYPPFVSGQFQFATPAKGRPTGAVIRLHRRPPQPASKPVLIEGLELPG